MRNIFLVLPVLLLILSMMTVPVLAQVPDIGPSSCKIAYDANMNLVPCGGGDGGDSGKEVRGGGYEGDDSKRFGGDDDNAILVGGVVAFIVFIIFLVFLVFPKSKTLPASASTSSKHVPKVPKDKVEKKDHVGKSIKAWGIVSLVFGVGSIATAFLWLAFIIRLSSIIIGLLAVIFYFVQQRYATTRLSLLGLLLGFVGFGYTFLDWLAWEFGYTIMYVYLVLLLFMLFVIFFKRKKTH